MAKDETKETLLQTLTDGRMGVPARRDEREVEPRELVEPSRETERGRSPEEVVGEREARESKPVEPEKKLPKKYKVRVDDGSGEPVVRELTLAQLEERGLLDRVITSANQLPSLSRKHQELLEQVAESRKPAKPAQPKPAEPAIITSEQIRNTYVPTLKALTDKGYYEPDFVEAYPMEASLIAFLWDQNAVLSKKLNAAIEWILAEEKVRKATEVEGTLNAAIEAVAVKGDGEKGDPLYKELRDPQERRAFVQWLRENVDPKVELLTAELVDKLWFAFKSQDILDFTKDAARKTVEPPPSKRRAGSDGSSARLGVRETSREKTLLERMTETRLGSEA